MAGLNDKVGLLIALERGRRKWSQKELAERADIPQGRVKRAEAGKGLTPERLEEISTAFGWTPEELLRQSRQVELYEPDDDEEELAA